MIHALLSGAVWLGFSGDVSWRTLLYLTTLTLTLTVVLSSEILYLKHENRSIAKAWNSVLKSLVA